MRDAVALDRAGVACIYLEGIPREVAAMITAEVEDANHRYRRRARTATGRCWSSTICSISRSANRPSLSAVTETLPQLITQSVHAFSADVAAHQFPSDAESYHLPKETQAALETVLQRKRAMRR